MLMERRQSGIEQRGLDLYGSATWESDGRGFLDLQRVADVPVSHFLYTRCDEILRLHADAHVGYAGAVHYLAGGTLVRPSSCVLLRVMYRHGGHAPYKPGNMLYHLESCQSDLQDPNKTALLSQIVPPKRLHLLKRISSAAQRKANFSRDLPFVNAKGQVVGPGLVVTTRTSFGGDSFSTGAQGWTINGHDVLEVGCAVPRQAFMWRINVRHPWRGVIDRIEIEQSGSITPLLDKPLLVAMRHSKVTSAHFDVLCRIGSYCGLAALIKLRRLSRAANHAVALAVGPSSSPLPPQLSSLEYAFLQSHCLRASRSLGDHLSLVSAKKRTKLSSVKPVTSITLQSLLHLEAEPADFAENLISRLDLSLVVSPLALDEQASQSPSSNGHLRLKLVLGTQCRWASNPGLPLKLRSLHQSEAVQLFAEFRGRPPSIAQFISWIKCFTYTVTIS